MEFITRSHRFAEEIIQQNPGLESLYKEITTSILAISDDLLSRTFENRGLQDREPENDEASWMSLSYAINIILDDLLVAKGWDRQSQIFQGSQYKSTWTLDFSKQIVVSETDDQGKIVGSKNVGFAVEVAFNHGEAIAWNLMKPVLAAEVNHLDKKLNVDAGIGIMIVATQELKKAGAFDGAVGSFERVERYLIPMQHQLTVPIMLIGLKAPKSFRVVKQLDPVTKKNKGAIEHSL